MNTIRKDDRTEEQKKTHTYLVTATDKFLSGWGQASGGSSKCAWACDNFDDAEKVLTWVENRSDMKYVNLNTSGKWYPSAAHVHIYVVNDLHPALN